MGFYGEQCACTYVCITQWKYKSTNIDSIDLQPSRNKTISGKWCLVNHCSIGTLQLHQIIHGAWYDSPPCKTRIPILLPFRNYLCKGRSETIVDDAVVFLFQLIFSSQPYATEGIWRICLMKNPTGWDSTWDNLQRGWLLGFLMTGILEYHPLEWSSSYQAATKFRDPGNLRELWMLPASCWCVSKKKRMLATFFRWLKFKTLRTTELDCSVSFSSHHFSYSHHCIYSHWYPYIHFWPPWAFCSHHFLVQFWAIQGMKHALGSPRFVMHDKSEFAFDRGVPGPRSQGPSDGNIASCTWGVSGRLSQL